MGSERQHQQKAESNQRFLEAIEHLGFPEWVATAVFYKAVHCVERMFAVHGIHTHTHDARERVLREKFPEILRDFRPILNYAMWARYGVTPRTPEKDVPKLFERLKSLEKAVELEIESRQGKP